MKRFYTVVMMLLFVVAAIAQTQTTNLHGFAAGSSIAGNGNATSTIIGEPFTGILVNNGYETTTGLAQAQLEVMEVEATVNYGEGYYENGFSYPVTTPVGTYTASLYSPFGGSYHYDLLKMLTLTVEPGITCNPITLPYSENFDGYTQSTTAATGAEPDCWELVWSDVQMTDANRPQIYYKSAYAHSGAYSLLLNYRGIYAMPELLNEIPLNRVKLEMYLRQPNAAYQLEVGVWDGQMFVPVQRFNNSGTGVEYVTCDFSGYTGNGGRIAFRNVLGGGANYKYSYNYIDDITLTEISYQEECGITIPYSEDFDSYTTSTTVATGAEPKCWELVQSEVQMTYANRPQIYYKSAYAHSGAYSLLLNYRGIYAMPELSDEVEIPLNRVKLEMYLRQPNAAYRLEVGVWDDATQTFEAVQLFNNSGTGVEYVTCDFSGYTGNGGRIAFRNVLGGGANYKYSYNYIDDITLTEIPYQEECGITIPYSEDFDSYTTSTTAATGAEPDCWELVQSEVQMTYANRPQIYYKSAYAHSGAYSLLLNYRGIYAMPELSDESEIPLNRVKLEMYLRQPNAAYRLEVGVWDDATQTFEAVQLFNNSTTNVEQVTCDFSGYTGNGKRIAFRNVLGSGSYAYSYNYLDDITLTEIEDCSITLSYTETFENFTTSTTATTGEEPTCWELVRTDAPSMPNDKRPQVYYRSDFAHSGSYSLLMNYRCVYAMPEISGDVPMNNVKLDMYLRQPNTAYQLQVGVWDDATSTFEPVALFKNSTNNVTHVECNFSNYSGNGRRIAFRNVLKSGFSYAYSYNYLDDITLTVTANKSAEVTNANATDAGMMAADRDRVDVVVYPNPTKDVVNVQCTMNNVQCTGVEVVDVYGKVVRTVVETFHEMSLPTQINVSGLAAGMYFVRVITNEGMVTKPFVKQ